MYSKDMKPGVNVRVISLGDTAGMNIRPEYLGLRQVGKTGEIWGSVPGEDDVWWIAHSYRSFKSGEFGPYRPDELEKI